MADGGEHHTRGGGLLVHDVQKEGGDLQPIFGEARHFIDTGRAVRRPLCVLWAV